MHQSILKDISGVLNPLGIPIETGVFSEKVPDEYLVLIPMSDIFEHYADDLPGGKLQEVRLSLFSKGNYQARKNEVVWLITLLANQSILIHNIRNRDSKKELLTEEEVELLTTSFDLASYKNAIMASMMKGTKRNVESEESKNEVVG